MAARRERIDRQLAFHRRKTVSMGETLGQEFVRRSFANVVVDDYDQDVDSISARAKARMDGIRKKRAANATESEIKRTVARIRQDAKKRQPSVNRSANVDRLTDDVMKIICSQYMLSEAQMLSIRAILREVS